MSVLILVTIPHQPHSLPLISMGSYAITQVYDIHSGSPFVKYCPDMTVTQYIFNSGFSVSHLVCVENTVLYATTAIFS